MVSKVRSFTRLVGLLGIATALVGVVGDEESFAIVVARHHEPVGWLEPWADHAVIYNKGRPDWHPGFNVTLINVPNEGREGETYLRYLTSFYDELPKTVIFLQGQPEHHIDMERFKRFLGDKEEFQAMASKLRSTEHRGYINLNFSRMVRSILRHGTR